MPKFLILDAGELFATVIARAIDSPATSLEGGEDFYAPYAGLLPKGQRFFTPMQYARLLGGNGRGSVHEVVDDIGETPNTLDDEDESEIYIACLQVWVYSDKKLVFVPAAVLSVRELDKPAREAVPIIDSSLYKHIADQFRSAPGGVAIVARDLGLDLMESHSAATVFGGDIIFGDAPLQENPAQEVAQRFGVPPRVKGAARRVAHRG